MSTDLPPSHRVTLCARCDWVVDPADDLPDVDQLLGHAADSGHPVCAVDRLRSLADGEYRVCDRCAGRVRAAVADLARLWPLLVVTPPVAPTARYSDTQARGTGVCVPGGRLAVMRGRGTTGDLMLSSSGDASHLYDEHADDPMPVLDTVADITDGWRAQRGDPAVAWAARSWPTTLAYVRGHLTWALNSGRHVRWDVLTLRALADELRGALGQVDRAERSDVRCLTCRPDAHGRTPRLERRYGDSGLEDDWRCPRCREVYDHARHQLALRAWLDGAAGAA